MLKLRTSQLVLSLHVLVLQIFRIEGGALQLDNSNFDQIIAPRPSPNPKAGTANKCIATADRPSSSLSKFPPSLSKFLTLVALVWPADAPPLPAAMLVYRLFRCCNKLTAKLLHTFLYLLAVPCIVVGVITVFDSHNLRVPPIPNLYSLHSWLGLVTVGLFALQLVVGFFSFWLLLCCEQGTASFRSGLVPVHATFGIITFMLAIATCVTGYTEKAFFVMRDPETKNFTYSLMGNEAIIINTQAAALAALGILVPVMVALRPFRRRWSERLTEHL
ncbi:putative cytochrome b reductase 1 isoform X1 [Penaeus vannamei]|uniref:Putative cytochrome b reductase 1 isoform X1 n=1 Tax=Penaeus vannamei TaxID=6689 RepID=A0A423T1H6_PENVA|nr:putative cytochrome b reductase 1 isoform X1 [Penaeus vannamei]